MTQNSKQSRCALTNSQTEMFQFMLEMREVFISSPNCPLFIWFEAIVFCRFYVFRVVFSTIVVSLFCPLYVIAILCFCAFWTK